MRGPRSAGDVLAGQRSTFNVDTCVFDHGDEGIRTQSSGWTTVREHSIEKRRGT